MTRTIRPLLLVLLVAGCTDRITVNNIPPTPTPPTVATHTIEMRVVGNATSVRIRHINPVDGLSQVTTVLPYLVTLKTDQVVMFLSLEVTPLAYPPATMTPFLSAQIFVNGVLFREGSSADFLFAPVTVSGTWRK
jgi:hypothetical protein